MDNVLLLFQLLRSDPFLMPGADEHRRQGLSPRISKDREAGEIWKKEAGHGDQGGALPAPAR